MNIRKQITGLLLLLVVAGSGCKKWLDVNPKSNVTENILFQNEQGFKDALTGVYTQLTTRSFYGKEFTMAFMDVLAQNYNVTSNFHNYNQASLYNYENASVRLKLDSFWINGYRAIANLNNLLESIDAKKQLFSGNNYRIIKGEALGLRAFLHFDLLRAFGPTPAAGAGATAIPYMTKFEMIIEPSKPAGEVIDLCLKDLEEASSLLSVYQDLYFGQEDPFLSFTRNHFNYWAVNGLMARINLWKGDLPKAYTKAKELIDAGKFTWVNPTFLNTLVAPGRTFHTEHLFGIYVSNLRDINTEIFRSAAGTTNLLNNTKDFIDRRFEVANGGTTDYRYAFLWKTEGSTTTKYPAKYLMDDLTNIGSGERRIAILRLSEMYYIAAEAATDHDEKITLLNEVRLHRGQQALKFTLTDAEITNEILKEYKKEFYQEGQLFFFYKRLNLPTIEGYGQAMSDKIYVLPKPNDEIEFNN